MEARGSLARLVRAFTFELLDTAGSVVGRLTSSEPTTYGNSRALQFLHNVTDFVNSRIYWTDETVDEFPTLVLEGPRYEPDPETSAGRLTLQDSADSSFTALSARGGLGSGSGQLAMYMEHDPGTLGFLTLEVSGVFQRNAGITILRDATDAYVSLRAQDGSLIPHRLTILGVDGSVTDREDRQMLRSSVGLAGPQAWMHDRTAVTTDASGNASVVFPEAFAATPTVVANLQSGAGRFCSVFNMATTGFDVNCRAAGGAVLASASVVIHWHAAGRIAV